MGVPIPKRFFSGEGKSDNDYRANDAFPWADLSRIAGTSNLNWSDYATADFKNDSNKLAVATVGFSPANEPRAFIPSNTGWTSQENYEGSYDRQVFAQVSPDIYRVKYYISRDSYVIHNGDFFTYLRYTDKSGYSYVWAMRTWVEIFDDQARVRPIYAAEQCMTNDCLAVNTGDKLDKIKFENGIGVTWSFEGPEEHRVFTLQETK